MREEEKQFSQKSKWQQLLRKKWFYPAVYIASAAIILTAVLWYQGASNQEVQPEAPGQTESDGVAYYKNEDVVPVNLSEENVKMPVLKEEKVKITKQFYDAAAPQEQQENALVFYNNTYRQSTGIDIAAESGETFDVVAALSGTVVKVENDSLLGNVVEVEHEDGVTTHYQSLEDVAVETGAFVSQGELIGKAGRNVYNKDAGIHTHFEVRKDGEPINPEDVFNKPLSDVLNEMKQELEEKQASDEAGEKADADEQPASDEDSQEDGASDESEKAPEDGSGDEEDGGSENGDESQGTPGASVGMARA